MSSYVSQQNRELPTGITRHLRFARLLRMYLTGSTTEQIVPKTSITVNIDSVGNFAPMQSSTAKLIKIHRNDNTVVAFGRLSRGRIEK
jgi:hypothetical protein